MFLNFLFLANLIVAAVDIWLLVIAAGFNQQATRVIDNISETKDEMIEDLKPLWNYRFKHAFRVFEEMNGGRFVYTNPKPKEKFS